VSEKKDHAARFIELLSPDSKNFLGTGLSMEEFFKLGRAEKFAASWANQDRDERKRRLKAVIALSIEMAKILETGGFATFWCERSIEAVIEGDWKMAADYADYFTFASESGDLISIERPRFATFRELLLQAVRGSSGKAAS
jgi:hypothetical protein